MSKPKPPSAPELEGQILSAPETPEAHQAGAELVRYVQEAAQRLRKARREKHEEEDGDNTSCDAA